MIKPHETAEDKKYPLFRKPINPGSEILSIGGLSAKKRKHNSYNIILTMKKNMRL